MCAGNFTSVYLKSLSTMRIIYLAFICLMLTSCARMLNSPQTQVFVRSDRGVSITVDTVTQIAPRKWSRDFVVKRDSLPLKITLTQDSVKREIYVKPILSRTVYFNLLNLGTGYLHDRHSLKRYTYPKMIWAGLSDTGNAYYKLKPPPVGMLSYNISVPLLSQFYVRPPMVKDRSNEGISGVTGGINYWYRHQHFFSLQAGVCLSFEGVLARREDTIPRKKYANLFFNIKHNHIVGMFDLGYGLSVCHIRYDDYDRVQVNDGFINVYRMRYHPWMMGLALSGYYHFGKIVAVGLLYQPQFLEWNKVLTFNYGHSIALDIMFRFPSDRKYLRN
jgi:hypothetical protein